VLVERAREDLGGVFDLDRAFEGIGVDGDGCCGIRVRDTKVFALSLVERVQVQFEGARRLIALEFAASQLALGAPAGETGGGDGIRQWHGHTQKRLRAAI
jgi:hypothetical protein